MSLLAPELIGVLVDVPELAGPSSSNTECVSALRGSGARPGGCSGGACSTIGGIASSMLAPGVSVKC